MSTTNISVTNAWTLVAASGTDPVIVSFEGGRVEVATTDSDATAPTVSGHALVGREAVTRAHLGAGAIWARTTHDLGAQIAIVSA